MPNVFTEISVSPTDQVNPFISTRLGKGDIVA
jgi:hypothetical protein